MHPGDRSPLPRLAGCPVPDVTEPWLPAGAEVAEAHRWVVQGLLREVLGGVVVAADAVLDRPRRAAALRLLVPAGAVVTGASAAWLHGGGPAPAPVEVAVRRAAHRCGGERVAGLAVTSAVPPDEDVADVHGVRATTPARTAVDVARAHDAARTGVLLAPLLRAGLGAAALEAQLRAMRGVRDVRTARAVLRAAGALP